MSLSDGVSRREFLTGAFFGRNVATATASDSDCTIEGVAIRGLPRVMANDRGDEFCRFDWGESVRITPNFVASSEPAKIPEFDRSTERALEKMNAWEGDVL